MKYEKPSMEIIGFETEDVIVTSNGNVELRPDELPIVPFG